MTPTQKKIISQLTENTGRHMLDSGGAYGRNWEHNQGRQFDNEPTAKLDLYYSEDRKTLEVSPTINLYHWLSDRLVYDAKLQKRFERFANTKLREDISWLKLQEIFPAWLAEREHDINGPYWGDEPYTVNTYNGESLLSQVLQYTLFTVDDTEYIALSVHGGCDIRGGYTKPVMYQCEHDSIHNEYCTIGLTVPELSAGALGSSIAPAIPEQYSCWDMMGGYLEPADNEGSWEDFIAKFKIETDTDEHYISDGVAVLDGDDIYFGINGQACQLECWTFGC